MDRFDRTNPAQGLAGPRYPGTFLLALREALAGLAIEARAWKHSSVVCVDAHGLEQEIGLENLYRRLRREPRASWPGLLKSILGSVPADAADQPKDLHEVADRLLVRFGVPVVPENPDAAVWSREIVEDHLWVSLVVDYPNSMSYVTEKQVAESGEDGAMWFERALANLQALSPPECIELVHEEAGLLQAHVGDAYDSSRALVLDALMPGHEENGFYVIVPGRDQLLFVPINEQTLMAAAWLRAIAFKMFQEMPYPISPEVFWVRGGIWHVFTIETNGDDLIVRPPPEFAEVVERLRGDEDIPEDDSPPLSL
ncbi:MAG: hypothetical protein HYX68_03580 [Planctomycetes bacterium]|jgi:hypothetical protein|nr:hypothetical protein [Planctomycetota bacterium]